MNADLATGEHADTGASDPEVGYALEIWEGYATDPEIRRQGSSGGLLSALALYCLEKEGMAFVLHTGMDETKPWTNKTVQSRNRRRFWPAPDLDMLPPHRAMNCASSKRVSVRASSSGSPVILQQWPCCARSARCWTGISDWC